jgi:hypothetical protein
VERINVYEPRKHWLARRVFHVTSFQWSSSLGFEAIDSTLPRPPIAEIDLINIQELSIEGTDSFDDPLCFYTPASLPNATSLKLSYPARMVLLDL